ncbi:MAG TPA: hypothetical protein VIT88_01775 [Pyrinomonadaceae bacterium]
MLKKLYSTLIVTLLCAGFAAAQQPAAWPKLESTEGRFRVLMPTKAEPSVSEVDSATAKINLYSFSSANKVGSFMVSYADYPNAASSPAHEQTVLDGIRGGVLKGLGADMVSETKLTLNGYPGREMRATKIIEGTEIIFSWRLLLVGRRIYQMGVGTAKADSESPDIKKFFLSFELVN